MSNSNNRKKSKKRKVARQNLCICGSGKSYRECCGQTKIDIPAFIRQQLIDFDDRFVDATIRAFSMIVRDREPDGCLSTTAALCVVAKKFGYEAEICYGLCKFKEQAFYHAWLEINGTIIDLAIYGNVNYNPLSLWPNKIDKPYIGPYENSIVGYGKYKIDEDWPLCPMSIIVDRPLTWYMDGLPDQTMWELVCLYLDVEPTEETISELRKYAADVIM